jgi:hypothetical protein
MAHSPAFLCMVLLLQGYVGASDRINLRGHTYFDAARRLCIAIG